MDIEDLFSSPQNLLASAYHHIDEVGIGFRRVFDDHASVIVVDHDLETGDQIHWARFDAPISARLQVAVFNAATELRAALDHAVYAASVAVGPRTAPTKTGFAFGDSFDRFEGELTNRCRHVPPEIRAVLYRLKPYPGGDETLWRLNKLRNVKDHRALLVPDAKVDFTHLRGVFVLADDYDGPLPPVVTWKPGGIKPRDYHVPFLRMHARMTAKYDLDTSITILFGEPPELRGTPVLDFLVDAHRAVARAMTALKLEAAAFVGARR